MPNKNNHWENILLSYDSYQDVLKDQSFFGTPEQLLNEIERSFEENHYQPASKEWVNLDLNTLKRLTNVKIKFFDLEE